jgi:hypothetical protein
MSMSEEIIKLKEAIEKLKQISDELKISELVASLYDVVDDLYHYVNKNAEYFFIRQVYGSIRVRGRYFEFHVGNVSSSTPVGEVYSAFFSDNDVLLTIMKQAVALLHDVVETLARRLNIIALIREVEQALSRLQERDP